MPETGANQKLDDEWNLALELTEKEREASEELSAGYNFEEKTWEVIVKYSGSLETVREMGIPVEEMINEYAILRVPESRIGEVSDLWEIEYMEKPKLLFFADDRAGTASCIPALQGDMEGTGLTGRGILTAVLDSGIDYFHEDFRNADGTTRIVSLWDQQNGRIYDSEEINRALESGSRSEALAMVPSVDVSGHGTAVAGIAAGNGRGQDGRYRGIAYESELLIVKLGTPDPQGFPRTTELMRAVNFAVTDAIRRRQPLAVNISFGNTYGPHDGTGLLETFLDDIGNLGKTSIIVGSGNEGAAAGHAGGNIRPHTETKVREMLSVAGYETGFSVQLWKSYEDPLAVSLQAPSGEILGPLSQEMEISRFEYHNTRILVYCGEPAPYSAAQEIYFYFSVRESGYVDSGIWTFLLSGTVRAGGRYDFWLPVASVLNPSTRFLSPTPDATLTIPSSAEKVITVGAYDALTDTYADFSGRGFMRSDNQTKPDIAAPGVGLMAPAAGGGYLSVTGTSFAAPIVTGSAALLMQWGILEGKDPYLYGEKLKAYLRRGARPLPGFREIPNPQTGYGALCLAASLPERS
ncbi:MAG: S8 family serine peptidase [Clostridiales bacterium]|nr:S8 family serine peptidase [Clostridiales bacterium]